MIENEPREGLKPLELAVFVHKRLAIGDKQAEIAKRLGKSRQWLTDTRPLRSFGRESRSFLASLRTFSLNASACVRVKPSDSRPTMR